MGNEHQGVHCKLSFSVKVTDLVSRQAQMDDIKLLPIKLAHLALIEAMPLYHKDPFDRLLIATYVVQ